MTHPPLAPLTPAALAFQVVDDILAEQVSRANAVILSLLPADCLKVCGMLREALNIATAAMGQAPGTVWYAISAPSPDQADKVAGYLAGDQLMLCDICACGFTANLAGTACAAFRELHGPGARSAWRRLRDAVLPPPAAPSPGTA